jgi:hypothetical protein
MIKKRQKQLGTKISDLSKGILVSGSISCGKNIPNEPSTSLLPIMHPNTKSKRVEVSFEFAKMALRQSTATH